MKELNSIGAPTLSPLPGGNALSVDHVTKLSSANDIVILDLRRPEAFGGAHVPGAINIGASQNLSLWSGWLLDPAKEIVLVTDTGDDEASRRALVRVGLDRIKGYLVKGMTAWINAGQELARTKQVSVPDINRRTSAAFVLDVRSNKEWEAGHLEGAKHIMLGDLTQHVNNLPNDLPIVTVCGSGYRSSIAASLLQQRGFTDISSMSGGMSAWNRQRLPRH